MLGHDAMGNRRDKSTGSDVWPYFAAARRPATGGWARKRRIAAALRAPIRGVLALDTDRDDLDQLCFEARVVRVDGRKILTSGTLRAGDTITAEADGIFVSVDSARFAELVESARRRDARGAESRAEGGREKKR